MFTEHFTKCLRCSDNISYGSENVCGPERKSLRFLLNVQNERHNSGTGTPAPRDVVLNTSCTHVSLSDATLDPFKAKPRSPARNTPTIQYPELVSTNMALPSIPYGSNYPELSGRLRMRRISSSSRELNRERMKMYLWVECMSYSTRVPCRYVSSLEIKET